jgi:hypothetical protein
MQVSNDPFSFQQAIQKVDEKNLPLHLSENPFKTKIREWINALNHNVIIQLSVYYSANVRDISKKAKFFPNFLRDSLQNLTEIHGNFRIGHALLHTSP